MGDWKVNKQEPPHKALYKLCELVVVWILTKGLPNISTLKGNFVS